MATRRRFLLSAAGARAASRAIGANDRIPVGIIGAGNRGSYHAGNFSRRADAEVRILCDVYLPRAEATRAKAAPRADTAQDYRRVLDRKDIAAVVIAISHHSHLPVLLDALAAGKDVFLEKPMTYRIEDGPRTVEAVRRSGRVVQIGTQQKNGPVFKEAKERFVDSGMLGSVNLVRTWWCAWPGAQPPPGFVYNADELDWAAFLGPARKRPFDAQRFFGWYCFADYSVGPFGTYGVHNLDVAHFFLNLKRPVAVTALGGTYSSEPLETDMPDTISLIAQYPEKVNVTFDYSRWGFGYNYQVKRTVDVEFRGSGGSLNVFRDGYVFVSVDRKTPPVERFPGASGCPDCDVAHMDDFLASVRNRKQPAADVVYSHYLTAVAHMGNLAHAARNTVGWDPRWDVQPIG